jgi:hypothetical protein
MDLKQKKLSKSEWNSIEIPVADSEKEILNLIVQGYHNVNVKVNKTCSLFSYLKIDFSPSLEDYLFSKYFLDRVKSLVEKYNLDYIQFHSSKKTAATTSATSATSATNYIINVGTIVKLRSADQIRVSNYSEIDTAEIDNIYEYILMYHLEQLLKYFNRQDNKWHFHYYTLNKLVEINVSRIIHYVKDLCKFILNKLEINLNLLYVLKHSSDIIEKNKNLLKFADLSLYNHQKQLFTAVKEEGPKLILYIAPTSTGKTISPLGLSENHKLIFVCAVRHVGISLARSAITINKKIAFAFGCSSTSDIRLHYFAATDYTKDRRSGKIRKVDNSVGDKVEIMICDVRSYLHAMHYMMAFNDEKDIITYWDEPTISMDYETHNLHKIIKKNWKENMIPNVVLSSATLPKLHELDLTINDFKHKFMVDGIIPNVCNIVSYDCRKTIPLIDNNGYIVMPHNLYENYEQVQEVVLQCEENLTLLRYIDLQETSKFCLYVEKNKCAKKSCEFSRNFASINDIDMTSIKIYYLKVLKNILPNKWAQIHNYFNTTRERRVPINTTVDLKGNKRVLTKKMSSIGPGITNTTTDDQTNNAGIYITTKDSYTLTDGPTIFIAKNLQKIAKFYIQQSNIPASVMSDIQRKLDTNAQINERIDELEKEIELEETKIASKLTDDNSRTKQDKKIINKIMNKGENKQISSMIEQLNNLKSIIQRASIDDMFIPNKLTHLNKWAEGLDVSRSFTSSIDDDIIESVMLLKDVEDSWKILLLLGIGVFTEHKSVEYSEIMKRLADKQKLYLIMADSDYIYGTNYQFCHGYLGKDLDLTQEKIIQSLGRMGRQNIQQEYTVRFRDQSQIELLFRRLNSIEKPEVVNMNILFNSKNIMWNKDLQEYEEFEIIDENADENEYENEDEDETEESHDEVDEKENVNNIEGKERDAEVEFEEKSEDIDDDER